MKKYKQKKQTNIFKNIPNMKPKIKRKNNQPT